MQLEHTAKERAQALGCLPRPASKPPFEGRQVTFQARQHHKHAVYTLVISACSAPVEHASHKASPGDSKTTVPRMQCTPHPIKAAAPMNQLAEECMKRLHQTSSFLLAQKGCGTRTARSPASGSCARVCHYLNVDNLSEPFIQPWTLEEPHWPNR